MSKILVAADFCPKDRLKDFIEEGKYELIFSEVKPIIESCDYSIVNFECSIAEPSKDKPIQKCGPALACSTKAVDAIKYAGFSCCTLANNHILDYGENGIGNMIEVLDRQRIEFVGGGKNLSQAKQIKYVQIKDETIAIINCCEHEFWRM